MTFTNKTFTAITALPALDLNHLDGNDDHVREEANYYPVVTAECVLKENDSTNADCYLAVNGSVKSPTGISSMNATEYDIDISAVAEGLHDVSVTSSDGLTTYFGPFKFYKSPDMTYLTMSLNSADPGYPDHQYPASGGGYVYETDNPDKVVNLTIIGTREQLNP